MALVSMEIPKVGLVMENARLVRWLKNGGDLVKQGEPLLELETEKSVVEIESTHSGRLVEILLQADQDVKVGDRVAWLETDLSAAPAPHPAPAHPGGNPVAAVTTPPSGATASSSKPQVSQPAPTRSATTSKPGAAQSNTTPLASAPPPPPPSGRVKSSPVARRLAAQNAVDLRRVVGTGPRGRVQLSDVRGAIEAQRTSGELPAPTAGRQPLTSMRRAVARSMTLSNATVPQFIVERAVEWTAVHTARTKLLAELPAGAPKPSVNDFLLQAIARSLLAFPELNGTFTGDADSPDAAILPASGAHIGLVVAVENGLLVPVFHDVEQLSVTGIARRRSEVVQRALNGRLKRDELEGATFSLSNLGARGPDRFTAIINPPQSAILAVGRQRDCVVVRNGGIHVKPMSQLTLTVDHRVADGRLAAEFLASLVEILEGDAWR